MDINWEQLHLAAKDVMQKAYAPYSNFKVGVAGLVSDGRIVVGCNSENASYGVGLCAECETAKLRHTRKVGQGSAGQRRAAQDSQANS